MKYFAALITSTVLSQGFAAWKVLKTEGTVNVKANDVLAVGVQILTGDDGKVKIKSDKTVMFIGPKSDLVINEDLGAPSVSVFNIAYGKLRAIVQKTNEPTLKIKTPAAVVGVRGTEFFVSALGTREVICTLKGKVAVEVIKLQQTIEVPAGKGLRLSKNDDPKLDDNSESLVKKWVVETDF